jgi:hypothetical protein
VAKQPAKRRVKGNKTPGSTGRVTPKAGSIGRIDPKAGSLGSGSAASHVHGTSKSAPSQSARYTPPVPKEYKTSPLWVPISFFTMLGLGVIIIVLNYVDLLPTWGFLPDGTSNVWLLVGLALILFGIILATQWQ